MICFAIVESKGGYLSILPSTWLYEGQWLNPGFDDGKIKELGNDKAFWPKLSGSDDFDRALAGELVYPNRNNAKPFRCLIKRRNIETHKGVS